MRMTVRLFFADNKCGCVCEQSKVLALAWFLSCVHWNWAKFNSPETSDPSPTMIIAGLIPKLHTIYRKLGYEVWPRPMCTHKNILPKRNYLIMSLLKCYTTTGNGYVWKCWKFWKKTIEKIDLYEKNIVFTFHSMDLPIPLIQSGIQYFYGFTQLLHPRLGFRLRKLPKSPPALYMLSLNPCSHQRTTTLLHTIISMKFSLVLFDWGRGGHHS